MAANIDFIDDDIDFIDVSDVDSLDVTALGNAFIKYADNNYPSDTYFQTSDSVMNPFKDYYELINNEYVLSEDTEFIFGKIYYEYDGIYDKDEKTNHKGYPHPYLGIYVGITEPTKEIERDVYNWVLRDTTTIDTLIKLLQESKQNKLSIDQLKAVDSGITSEKVEKYENYDNKINSKQDKLTSGQMNAVNSGITNYKVNSYDAHIENKNNPHEVNKEQIGLGNVVNTGDSAIPVRLGTDKFTTGGAYEMKRELDNNITYIMQILPQKQNVLVNQQNIKSINGQSILGSGNLVVKVDITQPIKDFTYDGTQTLEEVMDTKANVEDFSNFMCIGYEEII